MKRKVSRIRLLTEKLLLPSELVPEVPRTTIHGGSQVCIENHGGIAAYTRERIEIRTREGLLRVSGDGLELAAMTPAEIVITGLVVSVEFC